MNKNQCKTKLRIISGGLIWLQKHLHVYDYRRGNICIWADNVVNVLTIYWITFQMFMVIFYSLVDFV